MMSAHPPERDEMEEGDFSQKRVSASKSMCFTQKMEPRQPRRFVSMGPEIALPEWPVMTEQQHQGEHRTAAPVNIEEQHQQVEEYEYIPYEEQPPDQAPPTPLSEGAERRNREG